MKTSGIVALAIVVASMEVADAKCYIGYRTGVWQGAVDNKVQGGMVYIPTAASTKIMIRGFKTSLVGAVDNAQFYGGLAAGAKAELAKVNAPGTTGFLNVAVFLAHTVGVVTAIDNTLNGDVTLDLANAGTIGGWTVGSNVGSLHWLSISDSTGNAQHFAQYDFAPHFRGGYFVGMKHKLSGYVLVEGSDDDEIDFPTADLNLDASADTLNVRAFVGKLSWAASRDELLKITTGATPSAPNAGQIYFLDVSPAGANIELDDGALPGTTSVAIGGASGIATVANIKWLALYEASGTGEIVGYVDAYP